MAKSDLSSTEEGQTRFGYIAEKDKLSNRLRRIEGQIRGIDRMIAEERYCIEILTQIAAAKTALESIGFKILDDHVRHCVAGALKSGNSIEADRKTEELLDAVKRFARTN